MSEWIKVAERSRSHRLTIDQLDRIVKDANVAKRKLFAKHKTCVNHSITQGDVRLVLDAAERVKQ